MDIFFEVQSCLGCRIRISQSHWTFVTERKHLDLSGRADEVQGALIEADLVRISQEDENVYLYYRKVGKYYVCVVCRHLNGEGFIITAYLTYRAKEGKEVWIK